MNLHVISSAVAFLAACQVAQVAAHGYLVKPVAEFLSGTSDITQYSATFLGTSVYPSGSFSAAPADNVASFITNFADGQYSDIKTMILEHQTVVSGATASCGFSSPNTKQTLSSSVWWGKNTDLTGEGFVESHEGPCEAWCDDEMVMQNTNCATAYNKAGQAAEVPIDNSKCSGASQFTFYWIAMHTNEWQRRDDVQQQHYDDNNGASVNDRDANCNRGHTNRYHGHASIHNGGTSVHDGHANGDHKDFHHHFHLEADRIVESNTNE
uniref:Uncharacterized protein n=1 Tax=Globisporangium ultimum (strain ATCC 200006 / CBS 805.95 / DAOM BR144) TaxID=431595 RepID=K3W992_GLOUD